MSEQTLSRPGFFLRLRALLYRHWGSEAGKAFRRTMKAISDYNQERLHIDPAELARRASEGYASEKYAHAQVEFAKQEDVKIETELKRRTIESKVRQEEAQARKMEAEAGMAQAQLVQARLALLRELKAANVVLIVTEGGRLEFTRAPSGFDFEGLETVIRCLKEPERDADSPAKEGPE